MTATKKKMKPESHKVECSWQVMEPAGNYGMDSKREKLKNLEANLKYYEELIEGDKVQVITIEDKWGRKFGIGNPAGIKALMNAAVVELGRQILEAKWEGKPPYYESEEYMMAKRVEDALNCMLFDYFNFARGVLVMHRTLQQKFGNLMKECIIELADIDYDARNKATVEMCRELKPIVEQHCLPLI